MPGTLPATLVNSPDNFGNTGILHLRLSPSPCLQLFVLAIHLLALFAVMWSDIPGWIQITTLSLLVANLFKEFWKQYVLKSKRSIRKAEWLTDGSWRITNGYGEAYRSKSWRSICNLPALTIIQIKTAEIGLFYLLICQDSVSPELHRQVRARLYTTSDQLEDGV